MDWISIEDAKPEQDRWCEIQFEDDSMVFPPYKTKSSVIWDSIYKEWIENAAPTGVSMNNGQFTLTYSGNNQESKVRSCWYNRAGYKVPFKVTAWRYVTPEREKEYADYQSKSKERLAAVNDTTWIAIIRRKIKLD